MFWMLLLAGVIASVVVVGLHIVGWLVVLACDDCGHWDRWLHHRP